MPIRSLTLDLDGSDRGNSVVAVDSFNAGAGDLWFAAANQDRIDVIPEKRSYAPGETAKLQVRTPFREASALVSVEAGGIIETHVQPLSRYRPSIELPVTADWGPNVFVSVLAVRGRVDEVGLQEGEQRRQERDADDA